jgi:hypothetical protein
MCQKKWPSDMHVSTETASASMKFRIFFWDVLPCKIIVDRSIPDDGGITYL